METSESKTELQRQKNCKLILKLLNAIFTVQFKSDRRKVIYIFHLLGGINLREKSSEKWSERDLCQVLDDKEIVKTKKNEFYEMTCLSKNTFNKKFEIYLRTNNLTKRRTFTCVETFEMIKHWQGEGKWIRFHAYKKIELVTLLEKPNHKALAEEIEMFEKYSNINESYKHSDKLSPRFVKEFARHIGMENDEIIDKLDTYDIT